MPQDPNKPVSLPEWEETVRSHYGIPKELWSAMADQESGGDWKATSPTGVRGKYQVTQRTARQYNLNRDDPFEQVAAAGRYLKEQFDAVKGPDDSSRWYGALARYYGGPSAVDDQGNFSTRSVDGVSNPAEHVARVARRIEAMRKRAQDESLAPAQPQATSQAQTAAPADQPAPIQKAIQPLSSEKVDWTRRGPVMPQRPQPSFAGDPNADALQKMMARATVAGYKIPTTAEDAFKGRQRYATTPQAPKQSQRPGLLQDVAETALPFAAGGLAPIVSKTMPTPAEGSIRQAANVFGKTYSKSLAQIPQGLAQLGEAATRLQQLVPTQAPPDGLGPVSRIFDKPTQALVQGAEQRFPTNKQDQSWMTSKIPQVLGSVGAFATTGAVGTAMGLPSMASSALAGSGMQVASFMEEAKQTGIDPTRINQGIAMAGLTGMTEMFGLGKALDRFGLKKPIIERGLNILEEAGQEAFQGYLEDLNAKLVAANDPKRNIDPTSADFWLKRGEEAALGAIGGGLFAGADIVGNRIAARPDGGVAKVPDAVQDDAQPEAQPLIGLPRPPRSVRQQMTELQRPGTPPTPEQIDQAETAYRQRKPRTTPLQDRMRQMEPTAPLTEDLGTGLSQGQQAGTIEDRWGEAISNSPRPETVKTALEQAEQAQRQFDRSEADGRDTDALTALQRKDQALRHARVKVSRNTPGGLRARQRLFDEIKGNQRKIDQKKQQMRRRKGQPVSQPDAPVTGPMGDANAPTASGPMTPPTSRPSAALPREYTNRIDSNTDYPGGELPRTAGIRSEGQPIELPERTPPHGRGITPKRTPGPIQRPVGPQRPTTPMMGAEGSMMFADRPGTQYQMGKEGERIVREQEERVVEGTLEEGDFLGPRRARPDQPKFGHYGDVAMYLFKSPQPGDPAELQTAYDPETGRAQNIHGHDSVFNSPEVKGVLGLSRDANMDAVKDEINKDMARWLQLPADEVSLAQVPPSIWVGWAKMKGLSKTTLDKMYVAFDKATEKAQREGKEPPPVPQRLQTPFAKRQVSPLAGFTKGTNAQTPPTTQAAPGPREGQPTGRQATGSVEQPTRPATPPATARAERTGAPAPAADTGELTTGELRQEREKRQELRKRSPFGKDREAANQAAQAATEREQAQRERKQAPEKQETPPTTAQVIAEARQIGSGPPATPPARIISDSLAQYVADMPALQKGRAIATLTKQRSVNRQLTTHAAYIEQAVANGAQVVTRRDGRRALELPDGGFFYESDLSKHALDYADYLRKPAPAREQQAPPTPKSEAAPKPAPKVGKAEQPKAKEALESIRSETWDDGTVVEFVKSPFPKLSQRVESPREVDIARAKTIEVKLDDLYGTQSEITRNGLEKPRDDSSGLPLIVKSNGVQYIQDGHHRLAADKMAGKTSAKVRFVDLDASEAKPAPKSEAAPKPAAAEPEKTYTPEKKTVAGETTRATMPAGGNTMSDTAKQPWEMTREEFVNTAETATLHPDFATLDALNKRADFRPYDVDDVKDAAALKRLVDAGFVSGRKNFKVTREGHSLLADERRKAKENDMARGERFDEHYEHVLAAIESGKPVPPEVLADYPDLQAQPKAKPKPEKQTTTEQELEQLHSPEAIAASKQKPTPTPGEVREKTLTEKGWTKNHPEDFSGPDGATLKRNPETGLWEYTGLGGRTKYDSLRQAIIDIAGKPAPAPKVEKGEQPKAQPVAQPEQATPAQEQPAPAPQPEPSSPAAPATPPEPKQAKEPWQMTREELVARYKPGNPFAVRAANARLKANRLSRPTAHERGMAESFPLGGGFGRPGADKRIERSVNKAAEFVKAHNDATWYEAQAASYDEGKINQHGRRPAQNAAEDKIKREELKDRASQAKQQRMRPDGTWKAMWEVPAAVVADSVKQFKGGGRDLIFYDHRAAVEQALSEGKPVPAEVLADYPDLQAKPKAQPEQAKPQQPRQKKATPPNLADIMPPPGRPMEMKDLKQKLRDAGMPEGEIDQFILDKKASYEIALMKAYGPDDVKARTTEAERAEMVQDQFGNWYNGATRRTEQETQTTGETRLITKGEIYRDRDGKYFEIVDTVKTGRPAGSLGEQVDRKTSAGVDASDLDARIIVQPLKGKPGNFQPLKTVPARGDDRLRQQISQGTAVRVDPATEPAPSATAQEQPAPKSGKPEAVTETPAQQGIPMPLPNLTPEESRDVIVIFDAMKEADWEAPYGAPVSIAKMRDSKAAGKLVPSKFNKAVLNAAKTGLFAVHRTDYAANYTAEAAKHDLVFVPALPGGIGAEEIALHGNPPGTYYIGIALRLTSMRDTSNPFARPFEEREQEAERRKQAKQPKAVTEAPAQQAQVPAKDFKTVRVLAQEGTTALRERLNAYSDADLKVVLRTQSVRVPRFSREAAVNALVDDAESRLNRGMGVSLLNQREKPQAVTDAEQRLRENLTGERSGSGAQALVDQAIVTGYKLYRAGMTFAEWSRAMLKEMGQAVRPHLKATWDRLLTAVRQFIADEEGSFPASPGPGRNAWATPEEVLGTTKAPTKGLGGIRMEELGNVEETPKKQPRQRVVIDPLTGVRTVQKGGKPRTPREEMPDVPEIKMPRRLGGRDLRSPLTTLNQQGTYEALAGSLGKQVSDAFWDVTTQMATGELSRTQGIRELRAQLRPIKTELYNQGYRGMPEFIDAHVKQIESEEYDMFGGAARHLTALQYNLKLRFNPRAIAMNWLQPFQTLWPHFTTKEFVDLMAEARKRDVREQYKEIAARESGGKVEEATTKHPGWGNPFGMVSLTNRIMGHLAGLKIAERQGLTGLAKERMAAEWAAKVEYDNSARNVPPLFRRTPDLRGKMAAVLGQFKPFLIKNLERVAADWQTGIEGTSSGTLARRSKLVAAQMLIGGMKSLLLPGVQSLTGIFILAGLAKAFQGAGMDDDDANWWAEIAYFGLPAMIGQDFSSAVSLMDEPFGDTLEEQIVNFALGPTVSLATAIGTQGKDFFAAAQQYWKGERSPRAKRTPEQKMQGAALKLARTISPYTKTAIAGYYAVQGEMPKMWLGKEERMTPGEAVGMGLMGTPVRQSVYWEKQEAYDWQKKALGMPMGKAGSGTPTRPTLNRPAPVRPRRATESR